MTDMVNKIYLPNDEQIGRMLADAWEQFRKQADESGFKFPNDDVLSFAKDMFAAGYSFGYSDCLNIIRGQFEAIDIERGTQGNKPIN